ncbi:gliding motility-associated C-terminal domain-containing protein [Taibaiella sp. KBW10]|uniref:gliding motility-associated C-terminal domain-containing protein n=1 Tax=Taibaiella sp. KBW10 TaxID=2153357 RepID=UPI000F5A0460|nr:gliding motility-associated C-terminal domain-containing protein [Taibaiella sp. KBW10]
MKRIFTSVFVLMSVAFSAKAQLGMTVKDTTVCKTTTFNVCATPPASTLPNIDMDDKFSSAVDIGFPFTFYGQTYTQLVISDNNFVSFNTGLSGQISEFTYQNALNANQLNNVIMFPFQDLNIATSNGIIRYKTTGTAPNRRLIIEFCNVGYYTCNTLLTTNQLVLFEGSNNIEMHIAQKQDCPNWPIGISLGKGVQGVRANTNASAVFVNGRGPANASWTISAPEATRFTPSGSTYTVSSIGYTSEPFFNPGGTFTWYKGNNTPPYASTNCVNITTDPATSYYVAVYTGTIGCNSNIPMTASDTVFIHHNVTTAPKTLTYCQNQLPTTWNGMSIPAGTTSQSNYDTVLVTGTGCDTNFVVSLNITPALSPAFTQVAPICANGALNPLPTTSNNGIHGTWTPALNNTATTTYTFTPDSTTCALPATMTIQVNPNTQPYFDLVTPKCIGSNIPPLPTTSINGITGSWIPATISNTTSGTYIFYANAGQCALLTSMNIQINNNTVPAFTQVPPICIGHPLAPLPTISNNQITGTWSPAINNMATTTYTFTPDTGQCAASTTMTIQVLPVITPSFNQVPPICVSGTINPLPTTSLEGITGTWSPAIDNTTTTTYTFTPNPGQCGEPTSMTIVVHPNTITPTFNQIASVCYGSATNPLPATATNGISGTWSPTWNNTASTTYTFTPTPGQCAVNTTMTVSVDSVVPNFGAIAPVCFGSTTNPLPTTSTNGITGSWTPAFNSTATTTYTFTPNAGQCAVGTTTTTVTVNSITPAFTQVAPVCQGAMMSPLPTTSTNGVTGTWSPALNNTTTTTYTFSPTAGQCATDVTMTITVNGTTPVFTQVAPVCAGASLSPLPTTSTNGVTGTWAPAINNTATTNYIFTPTSGLCATNASMTIVVNPNVIPLFAQEPSVCLGTKVNPLPTTSLNGVIGTWSPIVNSNATTTYTFTPDSGQCGTNVTMTVAVNPILSPTFTQVAPICAGTSLAPLPDTASNGVIGTWSPALNNTTTTTYTFTPNPNQCAEPALMTITVNPIITPAFTQVSPICVGAALSPLPTTATNGITGSWAPALNNTATTTYTFTPTAGQCAASTTMTITVGNNTLPTFTSVAPICAGAALAALPTTSNNGITGTWTPALNNTATTTYTFTPTAGICATSTTMTITVNPVLSPAFTQVASICSGATLTALPTTSTNGVTGTWSPALNNTATTTYTFTPTAGQCANTATMTITVNPNTTPAFAQVAPICTGGTLAPLPTTSTNGITGTWTPALNNTATTTYTFTPTAGQCAATATMTINVGNNTLPVFTQVAAICSGATLTALPSTSNNGVAGTWSPALNNTATTTYTFTPAAGVCATSTTMTITVNPILTPGFTPVAAICSGTTLTALPTTSTNGVTGTWSPALYNTATTTYTFTPAAGQCATTATMTITVNPNTTPAFTPVAPICTGTTLSPLPTTSNNGVTGTWAPALNNTATTTYTFTPTAGQCAATATMTIQVNNNTLPTFTPVNAICSGASLAALPTTATNGITGTWAPALNNTATTTYTFTPAAGQCATTTTMTITVNPILSPSFTAVGPVCAGTPLSALPTTSTNGVSGTWAPAINNMATTTYTFTPATGQCATSTTMTITITPGTTPIFVPVNPICTGASLAALPTTSTNGISGTWSPALNNTATTTYTFTPAAGQCALPATMIITVNPNITPAFTQVAPICAGTALAALPTTANNGISGTWSPAVNNMATTSYTFTPNTTGGQCVLPTTMTIVVNPYLTGNRNASICEGNSYTFNGITYTTAISGVKDTLPNANGCDSIITLNLNIKPKTYGIHTALICQGSSYTFNGNVYTISNNTAKDTLINSLGCDSIITLNLTVTPVNPILTNQALAGCGNVVFKSVNYTNNTIVKDTLYTAQGCDSVYRTTNITVYPEYHYGLIIDTFGCDKVVYNGITYTESVSFKDTIRTVHGCDSIINNVNIEIVKFDLQASINPEDPYEGEEVRIQTNSADGQAYNVISWTPTSYFNDQTSLFQQFQANTGQHVVVTGVGRRGCKDTAVIDFKVRPYTPSVILPNAFTPNGDGKNDVFVPVLGVDRGYQLTDFRIFNRWGQLLFSTTHINVGWDGTFNGQLQSQDVYFYTVTIIFRDGSKKFFKGDVTLLR